MDVLETIVRFYTENINQDAFREAVMLEATTAIAILAVASPLAQNMAANFSNRFNSELIADRLSRKLGVRFINWLSVVLLCSSLLNLLTCDNLPGFTMFVFIISMFLFLLLLLSTGRLLTIALGYQTQPDRLLDEEIEDLRRDLEKFFSRPVE